MKRFLIIIFLLTLAFFLYERFTGQHEQSSGNNIPFSSVNESPTPMTQMGTSTPYIDDDEFRIAYALIQTQASKVELFSNVKQSTDSASAKTQHNCSALINAGFYTKERTHLGQFTTNGTTVQSAIKSTLVDGFFSIESMEKAAIGFDTPPDNARFVLQSGPIVRTDNTRRPLKLIQDEFARRMIAGVSSNGSIIFIALYMKDQEFSGPLLARVPILLEKIIEKEHIDITDALNLDGGSASAFLTDQVTLSEFTPIGGFFCVRP